MAKKSKVLKEKLSENESLFIQCYFDQSSPTFGNGTQSAIEALGEDAFKTENGNINYNLAGVRAYDMLRMAKIYTAGKELLNRQGFNDTSVEAQHTFLINQSAELGTKAKAIDMYYKLMNKYTEKHTLEGEVVVKWGNGSSNPVQPSSKASTSS